MLDGMWKAEDDPSTDSADKNKPTSRKYVGRYTYCGFTSNFLTDEESP